MKFDLPQISEEEFDRFHSFVRAVFDEGRQRFDPELTRITSVNEGFDPGHAEYLRKGSALAVTMENRGDYQKSFQIWITPAYKEPSFRFYATLAHELTHGYAGLKYGHNSHWRRWFYRVLWHLEHAKMIPQPESDIGEVCYGLGWVYNQSWVTEEKTLIKEAFAKAEEEHERVLKNYWKRTIRA